MIKTDYIKLNKNQRDILVNRISEIKKILDIKFSKHTVLLLTFIEFGILYLIYLYEDYGFSIVLKLLTVIPFWLIISITYLYLQKRILAWRLYKFYNRVLEAGKYPVIRILTEQCVNYTDNNIDYNVFDVGQNKIAILRQQDFSIDLRYFPNNDFLIPPRNLFEIIGNQILTKGKKINPTWTNNRSISKYINAMYMTEKGKILVLKKNNNEFNKRMNI